MKIKFSILLVCLLLMVTLSGCSNSDNESANGATVSDQSVFSPPEEDKGITGSWTSEADEITVNRYFYGNGNLVTIEQDPEDDTWVFLGLWDETNDNGIEVTSREAYHYDDANGEWTELQPLSDQVISATYDSSANQITIEEKLPNGLKATFEYKRGTTSLLLPAESSIIEKINDYLMQ